MNNEKKLVFIACPYTQLCDDNLLLKNEYIDFFEKLIEKIEQLGCNYFLACKRENWGKDYDFESAKIDYETIIKSDLVCVIPGSPVSGGVCVEIGWASAHKKDMNIFLNENHSYSPMITGVHHLTDVNYLSYDNEFDDVLIELIISSIRMRMNLGEVYGENK